MIVTVRVKPCAMIFNRFMDNGKPFGVRNHEIESFRDLLWLCRLHQFGEFGDLSGGEVQLQETIGFKDVMV